MLQSPQNNCKMQYLHKETHTAEQQWAHLQETSSTLNIPNMTVYKRWTTLQLPQSEAKTSGSPPCGWLQYRSKTMPYFKRTASFPHSRQLSSWFWTFVAKWLQLSRSIDDYLIWWRVHNYAILLIPDLLQTVGFTVPAAVWIGSVFADKTFDPTVSKFDAATSCDLVCHKTALLVTSWWGHKCPFYIWSRGYCWGISKICDLSLFLTFH